MHFLFITLIITFFAKIIFIIKSKNIFNKLLSFFLLIFIAIFIIAIASNINTNNNIHNTEICKN